MDYHALRHHVLQILMHAQQDGFHPVQVLKDYQGTISLKELSEMTAIKVEDVVSTLQHLNLIQYQKGQHVICAAPKLIERSVMCAHNNVQVFLPLKQASTYCCKGFS